MALDRLKRLVRRRTYDPWEQGVYDLNRQMFVPVGQTVYDPKVFGRFDRETQQVVRKEDADDGIWTVGFDELMSDANRESRLNPGALQRDRYELVLPLLAPGQGLCLDACTGNLDERVKSHVETLGYEYLPVDIDGGPDTRREDVTALSFGDASVARIMSLDTLEHVEEYRTALAEFARVLEPGGVLLVHVPVYYFDRPASAPLNPSDDPWGHVRYFSGRELVEAIKATGLVLQRVQLHLDYEAILCVASKPVGS